MIDLADSNQWTTAPCTKVHPDTFFPTGKNRALYEQVKVAAAICATCPIRVQCARLALDDDHYHGIWAGVHIGNYAASRRVALAELRKIAGVTATKRARPQRRSVPAPCAGGCGRTIRSSGASLAEFPGTLSNVGGWRCRPCYDRANGITRKAVA